MATTTASLAADNSTDAHFRAWITFIRDVFLNAGWVQTADTGQINFATASKPTTNVQKVGYAIFRMADSLQATHPVYVKFFFGSAGFAADKVGIWFSVGAGTDGAGNMVNANGEPAWIFNLESQTNPAMGINAADILLRASFGSGTTSRAVFVLFEAQPVWSGVTKVVDDHVGAESSLTMVFSIERAKDWSGADIGDYVLIQWSAGAGGNGSAGGADQSATITRHIYAATSMGEPSNLSPELNGFSYALAQQGPLVGSLDTPPIPFLNGTLAMPPGINLMLSRIDFQEHDGLGAYITGTTVDVTSYGVSHRYRVTAGQRAGSEAAQDSNAHVRILFE